MITILSFITLGDKLFYFADTLLFTFHLEFLQTFAPFYHLPQRFCRQLWRKQNKESVKNKKLNQWNRKYWLKYIYTNKAISKNCDTRYTSKSLLNNLLKHASMPQILLRPRQFLWCCICWRSLMTLKFHMIIWNTFLKHSELSWMTFIMTFTYQYVVWILLTLET